MKTIKIYVTMMIAVYAVSCSSDDDNNSNIAVPPQTSLIHKVVHANTLNELTTTDVYEYDDAGKLTSLLTSTNSQTYAYNADGRINKATINTNGFITIVNYFYDADGKLQRWERRNSANAVTEAREFTYNSDRYEERFYNTENELFNIQANYYSPDGKNISSTKRYYGNGVLFGTYIYILDNKIGLDKIAPFSVLPKPFTRENNVVQTTFMNSTGGTESISDYPMSYNAAGYPLTAVTYPNYFDTYEYIVR